MKPHFGRLFWKLFAALWLAMIVAFGGAVTYFHLAGFEPPHQQPGEANLRAVPFVSAAFVSLFFSAFMAWYLSRPLQHLRWGLRRAAAEHFDARVAPLMGGRRDEIADLAIEFDRMAASLEQLTRTRRTLLHDLSHELRSPLARMQVAVGLGRQNADDAARLAERIDQEIEHLDALVEELLTLHRLESTDAAAGDAGANASPKASVDLVELLAAITDDASFESSASGGSVVLTSDGPFIARVNGELVYRAFENVIRNAVRYSAAGTVVEVQAAKLADATLQVEVRDRGPGVPRDKLEAIFEPFVRLGGNAAVRGTGLGLAIARRAIVSQGGRIEASLREGGGLLMRMQIPAGAR